MSKINVPAEPLQQCCECNTPIHCKSFGYTNCAYRELASPPPEAAEPVAKLTREQVAKEILPLNSLIDWLEHVARRSTNEAPAQAIWARAVRAAMVALAAPSPVAQAPAQAGEVARLVEEAKEAFNQFYLDASDKSRRGMPSGASVHLAIDRLAALATPPAQPVLAPVVREPLTATPTQLIAAHTYLRGCEIDMAGAELDNLLRIFGITAPSTPDAEVEHG